MLLIFILISIITIALSRGMTLRERINEFSRGAGQKDLLMMVWIFVLAGSFAASAKAMGAVDAMVNLTLQLLPTSFLLAGLFIAACLVSLCMGTSVGTIVALMPIAASLADKTSMALPLMAASIVGGAFFGDNLSFISDTTIVATQSQGCQTRDKFRYNFYLVLPAAVIVCVIYYFLGESATLPTSQPAFSLIHKTIPYIVVLLTAALGMNVMIVLLMGNLLTGIVGIADGSYSLIGWTQSLTTGIMSMSELILISMLAGGIFALITKRGIMELLINIISRKVHSCRGAEMSICLLVVCFNIITANNTVAILSVGDIARKIALRYGIDSRRCASLLDTTSCAVQGLLPYGAQLLMASALTGITALSIIPYLYYPMLMGVIVIMTILVKGKGDKANY